MGEDRPFDVGALQSILRGIVNLARRWPRGKVAKKARIPVGWLPVVRWA